MTHQASKNIFHPLKFLPTHAKENPPPENGHIHDAVPPQHPQAAALRFLGTDFQQCAPKALTWGSWPFPTPVLVWVSPPFPSLQVRLDAVRKEGVQSVKTMGQENCRWFSSIFHR